MWAMILPCGRWAAEANPTRTTTCLMAIFQFETVLACPVQPVFDFLSRPANVARVSDPNLGLTLVDHPEVVQPGSSIEFQIVSFGQVHKLVYEVLTVQVPELIIEEQRKGPMKYWRQEHHFLEEAGGTKLVDTVEFELPGGLLGLLLSEEKLMDQLEDGFFHRQQQLKRLVGSGELS